MFFPPILCLLAFPLQIYPAMDIDGASSVVLQTLTQATSQDTAVLKPAEEQLRQWETQPGFYSVLLVRDDIKYLSNLVINKGGIYCKKL